MEPRDSLRSSPIHRKSPGKEISFIFECEALTRVRRSDISGKVIQNKAVAAAAAAAEGPAASWPLFKATLCNYFTASESFLYAGL